MGKVFEDYFSELQTDMVEICLEYVEDRAEKIYIYSSFEGSGNTCRPLQIRSERSCIPPCQVRITPSASPITSPSFPASTGSSTAGSSVTVLSAPSPSAVPSVVSPPVVSVVPSVVYS